MALQIRRGTDAERQSITPKEGELVFATDTNKLYVGGKISPSETLEVGGILVKGALDTDSSPQLSANLDLNGNNITGTGSINITGTITATGNINLGDGVEDNVVVGGQIASSLIPGSPAAFDLGAPAGQWANLWVAGASVSGELVADSIKITGDIKGDDSSILYNASTDTISVSVIEAGNIDSDLTGSVFADDSTALIDAVGKQASLRRIFGTTEDVLNELDSPLEIGSPANNSGLRVYAGPNRAAMLIESTVTVSDPGNIKFFTSRGTIENPTAMNVGDQLGGFQCLAHDGTEFIPVGGVAMFVSGQEADGEPHGGAGFVIPVPGTGLTQFWEMAFDGTGTLSVPTAVTSPKFTGDLKGSVVADDSTVIIDGVSGTIPGYISIASLKTEVAASADFAEFKTRIASL